MELRGEILRSEVVKTRRFTKYMSCNEQRGMISRQKSGRSITENFGQPHKCEHSMRRLTKLIRTERFGTIPNLGHCVKNFTPSRCDAPTKRSEEHTSELQSLMRISYAVFCLKKKKKR